MNRLVREYLSSLELGQIAHWKNMSVVPLFKDDGHSPEYMLLEQALERKLITITEVSHSGSVPELKIKNTADMPVLVLDGEELAGGKQNRVLNTTILIEAKCETVIPVSCVEQGRWSYVEPEFALSQTYMPPVLRQAKSRTVHESLKARRRYESDQGLVWHHAMQVAAQANVSSPTGAIKDVFDARKSCLDEYLESFKYQPRQKGVLVFVNGGVVGLDVLSSESAFEQLYPRLMRSYAMDALLKRQNAGGSPSLEQAREFIMEITECPESGYQSTGLGWDYRYSGKSVVGFALVFENTVIHACFLRSDNNDARAGNHRHGRIMR